MVAKRLHSCAEELTIRSSLLYRTDPECVCVCVRESCEANPSLSSVEGTTEDLCAAKG